MKDNRIGLRMVGLPAGLICLPCLLVPLLLATGFGSFLVFLGNWRNQIVLASVAIGLIIFFQFLRRNSHYRQSCSVESNHESEKKAEEINDEI